MKNTIALVLGVGLLAFIGSVYSVERRKSGEARGMPGRKVSASSLHEWENEGGNVPEVPMPTAGDTSVFGSHRTASASPSTGYHMSDSDSSRNLSRYDETGSPRQVATSSTPLSGSTVTPPSSTASSPFKTGSTTSTGSSGGSLDDTAAASPGMTSGMTPKNEPGSKI